MKVKVERNQIILKIFFILKLFVVAAFSVFVEFILKYFKNKFGLYCITMYIALELQHTLKLFTNGNYIYSIIFLKHYK